MGPAILFHLPCSLASSCFSVVALPPPPFFLKYRDEVFQLTTKRPGQGLFTSPGWYSYQISKHSVLSGRDNESRQLKGKEEVLESIMVLLVIIHNWVTREPLPLPKPKSCRVPSLLKRLVPLLTCEWCRLHCHRRHTLAARGPQSKRRLEILVLRGEPTGGLGGRERHWSKVGWRPSLFPVCY